ncbi:Crotonobetainyl-CoA:carnitine CoA-transferase CaiB [Roseovarius litoreus]|uniref:Crotonobetainyl-CoA:carnitine CoA-transferase CaiB n=1 Tax=Roseovarius litoreus TaxID=1155722 RepID=A0A1M7GIC8_9RHOB|nr:CoA transferase [Roseovarius litoreus]SHM16033.1 Crotonobetainyl-CoA:carnitine CoA-transferase CaiB [Roseovarius litoreus]
MSSLNGIKVIEFCEIAAGPFCGMLLADMGADVIKVERPNGDAMRTWPPLTDGYSENFASVNRGKRSICLNLKDPGDIAHARRLILGADVVLENFRPGVMQRNGLDYATMSALNPGLIYCSISAFGQTGPRSGEGGFDLTMQAMSGVMSVTGEPGGAPVKCGVPLCDFVSGLYGAYGIAAALNARASTGKGQHIDVSMLGATLGVSALQTSEFFGTGKAPRKLGSAHPRNAPYQAFEAEDGHFGMAAGNNGLWASVCRVVGREDLEKDPRFIDPTTRAQNQDTLRDLLEAIFRTKPIAHWIAAFHEAGVPCSPINTYPEVLQDPQVAHMGWVQQIALPNGVTTQTFGPVLRINDTAQSVTRRPPALGEHTDEILAQLTASGEA